MVIPLYLPFWSFSRIILGFHRDMDHLMAVVAMTMLIRVSEPFYDDRFDAPQRSILQFKIHDWKRVLPLITRYASVHNIRLIKVIHPWDSYARGIQGGPSRPYVVDDSDTDGDGDGGVEAKRENEDGRDEVDQLEVKEESIADGDGADAPEVKGENGSDQNEADAPELKEERISDQDEADGDDEASAPKVKTRERKTAKSQMMKSCGFKHVNNTWARTTHVRNGDQNSSQPFDRTWRFEGTRQPLLSH